MPASLGSEAQVDANVAVAWYIGAGALIAAEDFADEIDQALGLLSQFTEQCGTGARNTGTLPLRFPYSLI